MKKVIIIDYSKDERDIKEVETYKNTLRMKGHYVEACKQLSDLGKSGKLKNYDIAVCHRAYEDLDALGKEMSDRPGFKVIFTNFGWNCQVMRERQSDQVIYFSHPNRAELTNLIEKGW